MNEVGGVSLSKRLRFMADVNIEKPLIDFLKGEGVDVEWVADIDRTMTDSCLLEEARKSKRILITKTRTSGKSFFLRSRGVGVSYCSG